MAGMRQRGPSEEGDGQPHRDGVHSIVACEQIQQTAELFPFLFIRDHMLNDESEGTFRVGHGARAFESPRGKSSLATRSCGPVDRDGALGQAWHRQRLRLDISRQCGDAGTDKRRSRSRNAAVPRRRKHRIELGPEKGEKALTAGLDVGELSRGVARWPELAARRTAFVILMSEPVLVDSDHVRDARTMRELSREHGGDGDGNDRDVDGEAAIFEKRKQAKEPVVRPARFVIAKEQRKRATPPVERSRDRSRPCADGTVRFQACHSPA